MLFGLSLFWCIAGAVISGVVAIIGIAILNGMAKIRRDTILMILNSVIEKK